jgi:hypothetical protein
MNGIFETNSTIAVALPSRSRQHKELDVLVVAGLRDNFFFEGTVRDGNGENSRNS